MNVFVGHHSACHFWRTANPHYVSALQESKAHPSTRTTQSTKEARCLLEGTPFNKTQVHLEITPGRGAKGSASITFHSPKSNEILPFLKFNNYVYVASPETTFIHMAAHLTLQQLVLLGSELCSSYYYCDYDMRGFARRDPVTTLEKIRKAVSSAKSFAGKRKALRALRFICEKAESPMECALSAWFTLSRLCNGCGLEKPRCNYKIDIPEWLRGPSGKRSYRADFCWPTQKVIVEYDSDQFHTGSARIAEDSERRNALHAMGYTIVGITRLQIKNENELIRLEEQLLLFLGKRIRDARGADPFRHKKFWAEARAWINSSSTNGL